MIGGHALGGTTLGGIPDSSIIALPISGVDHGRRTHTSVPYKRGLKQTANSSIAFARKSTTNKTFKYLTKDESEG